MKKYLLLLLAIFAFVYVGCEDDDNTTNPQQNDESFVKYRQQWDSMITKIDSVPVTGDVELDFASAAIPMFQGEVNMLNYYLTVGKDDSVKTFVRKMIDSTNMTITRLRTFLSTHSFSRTQDSTYIQKMDTTFTNSNNRVKGLNSKNNSDHDMLILVIYHHHMAMSAESIFLQTTNQSPLVPLVQGLVNNHGLELTQMYAFLRKYQGM